MIRLECVHRLRRRGVVNRLPTKPAHRLQRLVFLPELLAPLLRRPIIPRQRLTSRGHDKGPGTCHRGHSSFERQLTTLGGPPLNRRRFASSIASAKRTTRRPSSSMRHSRSPASIHRRSDARLAGTPRSRSHDSISRVVPSSIGSGALSLRRRHHVTNQAGPRRHLIGHHLRPRHREQFSGMATQPPRPGSDTPTRRWWPKIGNRRHQLAAPVPEHFLHLSLEVHHAQHYRGLRLPTLRRTPSVLTRRRLTRNKKIIKKIPINLQPVQVST